MLPHPYHKRPGRKSLKKRFAEMSGQAAVRLTHRAVFRAQQTSLENMKDMELRLPGQPESHCRRSCREISCGKKEVNFF